MWEIIGDIHSTLHLNAPKVLPVNNVYYCSICQMAAKSAVTAVLLADRFLQNVFCSDNQQDVRKNWNFLVHIKNAV